MYKRILLVLVLFIMIIARNAFAGHYIADNLITYIGETELYYCYIYDTDVNLVIRFSDFHKSGSWAATVVLNPKTEKKRASFIEYLNKAIQSGSFNTMVMPNSDNKLWAFAIRVKYDNALNKAFVYNEFYLNYAGEIIAQTKTELQEFSQDKDVEVWEVRDLMDKHIHKRYQEEYKRRNTVVR